MLPQFRLDPEGLDQPGNVLDPVEPGHGEHRRLFGIIEVSVDVGGIIVKQTLFPVADTALRALFMAMVREIRRLVHARRHDVEFRGKQVDPVDHLVEPRHCIVLVGLVLSHPLVRTRDFLIRAGDDEIRLVHGYEIGGVLAGKMIVRLHVLPEQIGKQVLGFFQGMGDGALDDPHAVREEGCHQVAVGIVADDEVGPALQLGQQFVFAVCGEPVQVPPYFKAGNPVLNDVSVLVVKRYPENIGMIGAQYIFCRLVAGGIPCIGNKPGDHDDPGLDVDARQGEFLQQVFFQRPDLVENIDDLAARVRLAKHLFLPEPPVGRQDRDFRDHRHPGDELVQGLAPGFVEKRLEKLHGFQDARGVVPPSRLEPVEFHVPLELRVRGLRIFG